ncbi:hypothetical protein N8T08_001817 [Aspergillus melleus]|uniref:Uncharacterized protein n=1 Tax=Aspergillus melleus TaxID=138277 RepID=A0ACC3B9D7_9EURO|nr:hypothetical protein N8T08_001817 [Aspergillus melleus]
MSFSPTHRLFPLTTSIVKTSPPKSTTAPPTNKPLPCALIRKRDVPITLRDNTVIYTDVFLPANQSRPFPALVNFSSYGKTTPTSVSGGVSPNWLSGYTKFEGADAASYACRGYAVVNPDNRGAYHSEGNIHFFVSVDAHDGHDVIEWIAEQTWSTGKVASIGASWLAITQWFVAALNPPHLTAIVPWDGFRDFYRDNVVWGGIPDVQMSQSIGGNLPGKGKVERPDFMNAYWEDKSVDLEKVTVPAYVISDNIMPLHNKGTLEGFRRISSKEKWLRIDDTQEWNDEYNPVWEEDALQFLDYYVKGIKNGWGLTPRVRAAGTDAGGSNRRGYYNDWPIETTQYKKLYLDTSQNILRHHPSSVESKLVGYFSGHIFVEADSFADMDLFLTLEKLDQHGKLLAPLPACTVDIQKGCESTAGATDGTQARLRVSLRALDEKVSTPCFPVQSFKSPQRFSQDEIVPVDVAFTPNPYFFHAGQKFRLVIPAKSGTTVTGNNNESHVIHTGRKYQSCVQIPIVPE